ncbi:MAG: MCE family protein [Planctomycetes bacterium]|nr:MCE family protein [Planctomycetota bacterium]
MVETRRNMLVGVFTLGGLLMLVWLLMMFGEMPSWLSRGEYNIQIKVSEVHGISESTPVSFNGVPVGRVRRVEFVSPQRPGSVQIIASIKREFSIPQGTIAKLQPAGLGIGLGSITLVPPESIGNMLPKEGPGALIQGEMVSPFGDLISGTMLDSVERAFREVGSLAEALVPAAEGMKDLLEKRSVAEVDASSGEIARNIANLSTVVERADTTLKTFNSLFGDPVFKDDLLASLANIREISTDTKQAASDFRSVAHTLETDIPLITAQLASTFDDLQSDVNRISGKVMPAVDDLASTMASLKRVARAADEGEGTVGLLLHDARLYEALVLGVQRITDLVDTLRRMAQVWEADDNTVRIDLRGSIF